MTTRRRRTVRVILRSILLSLILLSAMAGQAAPLDNAVNMGNGWSWSPWLGFFSPAGGGWVYHLQHRWLYVFGNDDSSLWLWHEHFGWLWTSSSMYPWLYRHYDGVWLRYLENSQNPCWFYNQAAEWWEQAAPQGGLPCGDCNPYGCTYRGTISSVSHLMVQNDWGACEDTGNYQITRQTWQDVLILESDCSVYVASSAGCFDNSPFGMIYGCTFDGSGPFTAVARFNDETRTEERGFYGTITPTRAVGYGMKRISCRDPGTGGSAQTEVTYYTFSFTRE